jgi:ribosome-associated protein
VTAKTLARKISQFALTKKASDVVIADLRKLSSVADYFVICSAASDTQVKAIADSVVNGMKKIGHLVWHDEGYTHLNWVLLDYVDVVVHIFKKEIRSFYNLERLWGDAKFESVSDEPSPLHSSKARKVKKGRT